jgi:deoxyribodipyrimidine photo-lyase
MISPKKVITKVKQTNHENAALFIEEALIRRELAENYCFYNKHYTNLEKGAWPWAVKTLLEHVNDPREYVYTLEEFEQAKTHEPLWNYCQETVVNTGYLHSYLRMYWAKMVLYWSRHPQDAINILVYLNDTYMLDGRDPNGYTGIMWSVAGVHDRPWFTKPITGLVRSMSTSGTAKKTKINF